MDLELERKKVEIAKLNASKMGFQLKVYEMQAEIERIKDNILAQEKTIEKLELEINK